MTEKEAAQKVIDKILGIVKPPRVIAVFVGKDRNSIQMTRPDSDVYQKAIFMRLNDFCGVYNADVTEDMIIDDLRYAGFQP